MEFYMYNFKAGLPLDRGALRQCLFRLDDNPTLLLTLTSNCMHRIQQLKPTNDKIISFNALINQPINQTMQMYSPWSSQSPSDLPRAMQPSAHTNGPIPSPLNTSHIVHLTRWPWTAASNILIIMNNKLEFKLSILGRNGRKTNQITVIGH